jgi:DNA mismatch repair protein MutS
LRQTALIVLFSQIGCFIPAESAEIGIVDRIFTRVGASDDLTRGQSTFMLEMNEMAQILNYATENSLIIIDELGRGTGTIDGESIAQAVIEYLHDFGVKTLFSTHFHQLTDVSLPRVRNYHFKILEKADSRQLVFLRQLTEGGTDKSYGIHVAMMAGLPKWVTNRAFVLMEQALREEQTESSLDDSKKEAVLKNTRKRRDSQQPKLKSTQSSAKSKTIQTSLFPVQKYDDSELVIKLRSLDLNHMTPIEAFETLVKLKDKVTSGDQ